MKRQRDAEELGQLRKTMRKRNYEWLKDGDLIPFARDRAFELEAQIRDLLTERYGFDITDRFLTADNVNSSLPFRLVETDEYAGWIKRLRGIIRGIHSGKIRRKVEK